MDESKSERNKSKGSDSKDRKTEISSESFNRMILLLGAVLPSITSILVTFITVSGNLAETWISNSHTSDKIQLESNNIEVNDAVNEIAILQNSLDLYRERIEAGDLRRALHGLEVIDYKIEKMQFDLDPDNPLYLKLEKLKEDSDVLKSIIEMQSGESFAEKASPLSFLVWMIFAISIFFVSRAIFLGLFRRKFKSSAES
jgi:hypothetical protein